MSLTQKAIDLLRKVKAHILEEPRRFTMDEGIVDLKNYTHPREEEDTLNGDALRDIVNSPPACGTAACIAGWTYLISKGVGIEEVNISESATPGVFCWYSIWMDARDALGIATCQASQLFFVENWPTDLDRQYLDAIKKADRKRMAEIAAERIDKFIEENKSVVTTSN